jgi:hypothetical protein
MNPVVSLLRAAFWLTLACGSRAATSPRSPDVVHLHLTFVQSTPVTAISVGGQTIQTIVDTSAGDADGALTLSHDVIVNANGTHLGDAVMDDELGRQFLRPRYRIPVVEIDGHAYHDINAVEALPPEAGENSPLPNVMGKFFLSRHFVVVDFAAATVSLWPRAVQDPIAAGCGRRPIPMERTKEARLAVSTFDLAPGRARLGWSTSASFSLLAEATAKKLHLQTVTHGPEIPRFYQSRNLAAAGHDFGVLEFAVLPLKLPDDFEGVIGGNFFAHHVVCLDYERREIRVR